MIFTRGVGSGESVADLVVGYGSYWLESSAGSRGDSDRSENVERGTVGVDIESEKRVLTCLGALLWMYRIVGGVGGRMEGVGFCRDVGAMG